ncbi:MAG: hypothetical protein JWQ57_2025 [Mucilaginibacter sp.]|nr:hypothetical protein [Mucilaginibacter sp.]
MIPCLHKRIIIFVITISQLNEINLSFCTYTYLFAGCKKQDNKSSVTLRNDLHLQLISKVNITDTVGNFVKDSVIVKIVNDKYHPIKWHGYFVASGCDVPVISGEFTSNKDSTIIYPGWRLGVSVNETLKFILEDENHIKKDSITVNAKAIAPGKGWHASACIPPNGSNTDFARLRSGRIFTCVYDKAYVSSDNGISWSILKSVPNMRFLLNINATPGNELLIGAKDVDGVSHILYSADEGVTWEDKAKGQVDLRVPASIYSTKSLFFVQGRFRELYQSDDKAKNWLFSFSRTVFGDNDLVLKDPVEGKNGQLFVLTDMATYTSDDKGKSWHYSYYYGNYAAQYIDEQGAKYASLGNRIIIYKNSYETADEVINLPDWVRGEVFSIRKFGSKFCLFTEYNGTYITTDFKTFTHLKSKYNQSLVVGYDYYPVVGVLANNGNLIVRNASFINQGTDTFYYIP